MSNPLRGRVLIMSTVIITVYYSMNIISMSFFSLPYRLKLILAYKNLRKLKKGSLIWNCFKNGSTTASPPLKECFAAHHFTPQSAPQWTPNAAWDNPNHWCNPQWIWARAHRTENEECATLHISVFPAKWSSPFSRLNGTSQGLPPWRAWSATCSVARIQHPYFPCTHWPKTTLSWRMPRESAPSALRRNALAKANRNQGGERGKLGDFTWLTLW